MSTKKTALTMTDSERCFGESSYNPDLPENFPMRLKDENNMLKIIVEEQNIALDMIMRKYREHTDRITKLSQVDLRKLYYKRYFNTIVNQANKMYTMSQTMRKNLLVILKYEEIMREMETENERLREMARSLSEALKRSKKISPLMKETTEVSSQTDIPMKENKSVGSDNRVPYEALIKPSSCTKIVPYVSLPYDVGSIDRECEALLSSCAVDFQSLNISGEVHETTKNSPPSTIDLDEFEDLSSRVPLCSLIKPESESIEEVYDDVQ